MSRLSLSTAASPGLHTQRFMPCQRRHSHDSQDEGQGWRAKSRELGGTCVKTAVLSKWCSALPVSSLPFFQQPFVASVYVTFIRGRRAVGNVDTDLPDENLRRFRLVRPPVWSGNLRKVSRRISATGGSLDGSANSLNDISRGDSGDAAGRPESTSSLLVYTGRHSS